MKTFWLVTDGAGGSRLDSLPLPFLHVGATVTEADRSRTPDPGLATHVRTVQPLSVHDGETTLGRERATRRLVFVVAGSLDVDAGAGHARLLPGDVLFVDDGDGADHKLTWSGEARAVEVEVDDLWAPAGSVPPALEDGRDPDQAPRLDRIRVVDDVAQFGAFDTFIPSGAESADQLTFLCLSPGLAGDWHTEEQLTLVIVLAGGFELEVGAGADAARTFRPGDVCLVEDDHGQGHQTRTHGETRIAVVGLPAGHRWS